MLLTSDLFDVKMHNLRASGRTLVVVMFLLCHLGSLWLNVGEQSLWRAKEMEHIS